MGELQLVIPRALCRFGRFDLSKLPQAKRASALALQLPGWSPFAESDQAIAWNKDGVACVWCWDRGALLRDWAAHNGSSKLPRVLPEPALREPPAVDGVRLFEALQGHEAQHWEGGELLASRWWSEQPLPADQLSFLRDCGLGAAESMIDVQPAAPALLQKPWVSLHRLSDAGGQLGLSEKYAYAALAFLLMVPALYLGVDHLRLFQARTTALAELARAEERSRGLLSARDAALAATDQVRALQQLQPYPDPLVLMTALARALPEAGGSFIREWEQSEGRLRFLIASPSAELVGAEHVRALESTGLFSDLKLLTQSNPQQMAFSMQLKSQQALQSAAADAVPAPAP